jgi:hypothetical protein
MVLRWLKLLKFNQSNKGFIMRVYLALDFDGIDANSEMADTIINSITEECDRIRIGLNADLCYVDDAQNTEDMDTFNESFNEGVKNVI